MGAIKGWKTEDHRGFLGNIKFWRNKTNQGFVEINRVEKGAPAYSDGKYQVAINTPHHIITKYFNSPSQAENYIRAWMQGHPKG